MRSAPSEWVEDGGGEEGGGRGEREGICGALLCTDRKGGGGGRPLVFPLPLSHETLRRLKRGGGGFLVSPFLFFSLNSWSL